MRLSKLNQQNKTIDMLNRVLNRTYLGILSFTIPMLIISAFRIKLIGILPVVVFSLFGPLFLFIIYLFRKKIPYIIRAWIIIASAYLLGLTDVYSLGMFSMGTFLFFVSAILASIFLPKKYSDGVNILTITTYILFVIFIYQRKLTFDFDISTYFYSLEGWSSQLITFIVLLGAIVYAVRALTLANVEINHELDFKNDEVEATYMQLKALDAELQDKYDELLSHRIELIESELKYRTLFNNLNDYVFSIDLEGRFLTVNATFLRNFRLQEKDILGLTFEELMPTKEKDSTWTSIILSILKTKEKKSYLNAFIDPLGNLHTYEVTLIPFLIDDSIEYIIGTSHDVTALLEKEKTIEKLAFEDQLTQLPNRTAFKQFVKNKISEYTIGTYPFALIYIDLDNFKRVNDTIGHSNGDILLKDVAKRLSSLNLKMDYFARMGGDEFALIVTITNTLDDLKHIVTSIQSSFAYPFLFESTDLHITASMGVTIFPYDGLVYSDLLKNADSALYEAKRKGKHDFRFFDVELKQEISKKIKMEHQLNHALENKEIYLNYQPQYDSNGFIRGFEALMRWNSPEYGQVPPMSFIPIIEENGLIINFGEWVLREAITAIKEINYTTSNNFTMSVNISAIQFQSGKLVNYITTLLKELALPPYLLEIEITESIFMDDIDYIIETLNHLTDLGVSIALDDFGTGYSSLSYLRRLPLSILKIDKSFINAITSDSGEDIIVGSLINLSHDLNLKVVAEGIETQEQASYLIDCDCDYQQGYYYSKPVSLQAILTLINSTQAKNELE